jgi:hypothetical protein
LANYHFAIGLQREFEERGLKAESLCAHPGLSNTNLQTHTMEQGSGGLMGSISMWMAKHTGMSPEDGVRSQLRAATDPNAKGGEFYGPLWVNNGAPVRKPILRPGIDSGIEDLWMVSERETGVALDFDTAQENA